MKKCSILIIIYFVLIYIANVLFNFNNIKIIGTLAIMLVIIIAGVITIKQYKKEKKIDYKKIIITITIIGIIIRAVYILYTPITERQHDMEEEVGHLAYIETIYETKKLPTHNKWQFYHQPLHHIIAASWLKINEIFGINLETAEEGLQILTATYSSMIIIITYYILKEMNIKDWKKVLVITIISIHPTLIILSRKFK